MEVYWYEMCVCDIKLDYITEDGLVSKSTTTTLLALATYSSSILRRERILHYIVKGYKSVITL